MENPTFHLTGIVQSGDEAEDFTGPLSLILMLLSKNKIEIRDLKISEILDQYIAYIAQMQEMDLEVASEFVQMASYLVYIKTRTLLVGEEEVSELEELMTSLERLRCQDAYVSIKAVTSELSKASEQGLLLFSKPPEPVRPAGGSEYQYSHSPSELLTALASVFARGSRIFGSGSPLLMPKRIVYGVKEKSSQLIEFLKAAGTATLKELYGMSRSRSEVVATFISVLELCSTGNLSLCEQDGEFTLMLNTDAPILLIESVSE